jgi:hypothetical protein
MMSRTLRESQYPDAEVTEGGDVGEGLSNQPDSSDDDSNNE